MSQAEKTKAIVDQIRKSMAQKGISAYIIPTADAHLSEYIADHWQARRWASGFTGSAGTLLIGEDMAGLWTDSRYYLQAEDQLAGTGIDLYKDGLRQTPKIEEVICNTMQGKMVGIDGRLFAWYNVECMAKRLAQAGISLKTDMTIDQMWTEQPEMPSKDIFVHELKHAGQPAKEKMDIIRKEMSKTGATHCLISQLDEVAYVLNLRGGDVEYNPVFYAYLLVGEDDATLFCNSKNRDIGQTEAGKHLKENNVKVDKYDNLISTLKDMAKDGRCRMMLDKNKTNYTIVNTLPQQNIVGKESPVSMMKAVKNGTEIATLRKAQSVDSVALTQAFCWLDKQMEKGERVTELSFANHLDQCRAEQEGYVSLSFNTISGLAEHGAIVHYGVTEESDKQLEQGNFLLVDSGGNYLDGTTDITRTVMLGGKATPEQKHDYTLVLKGHIALAKAIFPEGTTGTHLDTLARMPLWQDMKNYGHGTGHGIGHFLCVHEGPQRISPAFNPTPLKAGMLISNEPGLYVTGKHGIRLENMVCVQECGQNEYGHFLKLETMSYFPFDKDSIEPSMLTDEEKEWINNYHRETREKIESTGKLTEEELAWLYNKTAKME